MMGPLIAAVCALSAALAACLYCLWRHRREALRLQEQILCFLDDALSAPSFSVRDNSFALFENAVVELETRLVLSRESAREQNKKMRVFIADASHQFKTPLAALKLYCEMDGAAHGKQQIELIEHMEVLIGSMLRLERLRTDGYEFDFRLCDMGEIAREICGELRPLYPRKRFAVVGEARAHCDGYWMGEAVRNLIKNACEHTPPCGEIIVTLSQSESETALCVCDDGGGVSQEALPRLFERFYRGDKPTLTGGAGLGLSIARSIIHRHHGSITARNAARGLAMDIYLPALHEHLKKT